jgi:hypothetical protein
MWDIFLSTAGCLVFTHGCGLAAMGKKGLSDVALDRAAVAPRTPFADVDAVDPAGT